VFCFLARSIDRGCSPFVVVYICGAIATGKSAFLDALAQYVASRNNPYDVQFFPEKIHSWINVGMEIMLFSLK
jgi:hypothetical protein